VVGTLRFAHPTISASLHLQQPKQNLRGKHQ